MDTFCLVENTPTIGTENVAELSVFGCERTTTNLLCAKLMLSIFFLYTFMNKLLVGSILSKTIRGFN